MKWILTSIKRWLLNLWYLGIPRMQKQAQEMLDKIKLPDEPKSQGKVIWDGRMGVYRRRTPRLSRNAPCPCGAMRTAPRDTTKRIKAKWCCAGMKPISILKGSA